MKVTKKIFYLFFICFGVYNGKIFSETSRSNGSQENNQTTNVFANPNVSLNPDIVFNPKTNITASPSTNITVSLVNIVEVATAVSTKIKMLFDGLKHQLANQDYRGMREQFKEFLWKKRYKIGVCAFGGLYGSILAYLFFEYHFFIKSSCLWAHWKSDCTFGQLCEISQQQLSKELLLAVQARAVDPKNPTNFAQPLISFMYAIDEEIKRLERYIVVANAIYRLRIGILFPTNDNKISHVKLLLERTQFIRHIFLSWLAGYNMSALKREG